MEDKELYQQKKQAQLDAWKADIAKLKAKTSMASADAQIKINEHIRTLEHEFDKNKAKLTELKKSADEAYESMKIGVESAWDKLADTVNDAKEKFKH